MSNQIYTGDLNNSWEPQQRSTINELSHHAPSISNPPTNLVPYSRYSSQNYPQYSVGNEQQIQPKYQSWSPQVNQTNMNTTQAASASNSCSGFISAKFVLGLLIGIVICSIPIAVLTALYVQEKSSSSSDSSSSNTGSSGSSSSNSSSLPSQCTSNSALSDVYRLYTYTGCCYSADCSLTAGWYRIQGSAGSQLVTTPMSTGYCGQSYPAWFNSSFPSTPGTTITGGACVNYGGTICSSSYSTTVSVTNCNGYYVFYLVPFGNCNIRYCTM